MSAEEKALVLHYLTLRRLVGLLAVGLPIVLPLGLLVIGEPPIVRESISAYHSTGMRDLFVCLVSSMGVFLFAYRGYEGHRVFGMEIDRLAGTLASACAALIALCPVDAGRALYVLHLVGGTGMFASLAFFSLFLFTRSHGTPTPRKRMRNVVYRVCGGTIVLAMVLMGIEWGLLDGDPAVHALHPTFWLEAVMLFAFGISWAIKGEVLLADG